MLIKPNSYVGILLPQPSLGCSRALPFWPSAIISPFRWANMPE